VKSRRSNPSIARRMRRRMSYAGIATSYCSVSTKPYRSLRSEGRSRTGLLKKADYIKIPAYRQE
jgi:hypothetical protein